MNYNPEGSAYVQDRWEFEGLVLNAGIRYDMFTPGAQIQDAELTNGRYKQQFRRFSRNFKHRKMAAVY